jgi:hypothetical protein
MRNRGSLSHLISAFKAHIELLKNYSDKAYNWLDESERKAFTGVLRRAASPPFKFGGKRA